MTIQFQHNGETITIGQEVSYIRQISDEEIIEGKAKLMGIHLDADKRPNAHLHNPDAAMIEGTKNPDAFFNVPILGVNPTEKFKDEFKGLALAVKSLADASNEEIRSKVADANQAIHELRNGVLGHPVNL